jgi:hypothetical protein
MCYCDDKAPAMESCGDPVQTRVSAGITGFAACMSPHCNSQRRGPAFRPRDHYPSSRSIRTSRPRAPYAVLARYWTTGRLGRWIGCLMWQVVAGATGSAGQKMHRNASTASSSEPLCTAAMRAIRRPPRSCGPDVAHRPQMSSFGRGL